MQQQLCLYAVRAKRSASTAAKMSAAEGVAAPTAPLTPEHAAGTRAAWYGVAVVMTVSVYKAQSGYTFATAVMVPLDSRSNDSALLVAPAPDPVEANSGHSIGSAVRAPRASDVSAGRKVTSTHASSLSCWLMGAACGSRIE